MATFTDKEIDHIIKRAVNEWRRRPIDPNAAPVTSPDQPVVDSQLDPLDDENNPNVPKGGTWGVTGAGMTPAQFRERFGKPGLAKSASGRIKSPEVKKVVDRARHVEPDAYIAYSRGAAMYNSARQAGLDPNAPVTYVAPSSYRFYGDAPVPHATGGKVIIGDRDKIVPYKQAAKTAVNAGLPMYVLPGKSHLGIMYSKGEVTPDSFEVDAEAVVEDPEMPDWGRKGGASEDQYLKQKELVKQHIKQEAYLRKFVSVVLKGL